MTNERCEVMEGHCSERASRRNRLTGDNKSVKIGFDRARHFRVGGALQGPTAHSEALTFLLRKRKLQGPFWW